MLETPGMWVRVSNPHVCPASSKAISRSTRDNPFEGDVILAMDDSAPKLSDLIANRLVRGNCLRHALNATRIARASHVVVKALSPREAEKRSRSS